MDTFEQHELSLHSRQKLFDPRGVWASAVIGIGKNGSDVTRVDKDIEFSVDVFDLPSLL